MVQAKELTANGANSYQPFIAEYILLALAGSRGHRVAYQLLEPPLIQRRINYLPASLNTPKVSPIRQHSLNGPR